MLAISNLNQRLSALEAKSYKSKSNVATFQDDHLVTKADLVPYITNLYQRVSTLETRVSALETDHSGDWVPIDPNSPSYQQLGTTFGVLLVKTKSVTPYLDGYKVKVEIGNPYNMTFGGFQLAYWVIKTRSDNSADTFTPPPLSTEPTTEDRTETLQPGSWNEIAFTVAPATADDIRNLCISIRLNQVHLNDDSSN